MPIRIRLTGAVAVVDAAARRGGGFLFLRSFRHGLATRSTRGSCREARVLVHDLQANPTGVDLLSAETGFATNDAVAEVLDPTGRVLANTREAGAAPVLEPPVVHRASAAPITVQGLIDVNESRTGCSRGP